MNIKNKINFLKDKDKICEDYRKQVEEFLDNQSESELIQSLNQKELDEIWEEISSEFDIGDVWTRISSDLDHFMPVGDGWGIFAKSIAAAIIILISLVPVDKPVNDFLADQPVGLSVNVKTEISVEQVLKNQSTVSGKIEEKKGVNRSFESLDENVEKDKPKLPAEDMNDSIILSEVTVRDRVVAKFISVPLSSDLKLPHLDDRILSEKSEIIPVILPVESTSELKIFSGNDTIKRKLVKKSSETWNSFTLTGDRRISAGLTTIFKSTSLINQKTLDGLKPESLNSSEFVFFPEAGISLNYSLNRRWMIQADGFFTSNTGQRYKEYLYGHYSSEKITLKYSTIALSFKHRFLLNNRPAPGSSINISAGSYFSVLRKASQKINSDLENIKSQYEPFDFGVQMGSEFEVQISDQLSFAPGLFLSFGFPNIYKGTDIIPGYLIRTHNGSAELRFSLFYHFY